jgi:hypothetical protein
MSCEVPSLSHSALTVSVVANSTNVPGKRGLSVATTFPPDGKFMGGIPGPQGLHGTFLGGRDKRTLFRIVFYSGWGTPSARNQIIAIPTIAQGYTGRAK